MPLEAIMDLKMPENLLRYHPDHHMESFRLSESECGVPSPENETRCWEQIGSSQQPKYSAFQVYVKALDTNTRLEIGDAAETEKSRHRTQQETDALLDKEVEEIFFGQDVSTDEASLQSSWSTSYVQSHSEGMKNALLEQIMHLAKLGSYVKECYENSWVCDVRFLIENTVLFAHRTVLCSVSPYFAFKFNEHTNPNSRQMADVRIRGVSMKSFKAFVDFVYTGHLDITTATMIDLIKISQHFDIPEIKQRCVKQLAFLSDGDLILMLVECMEKTEGSFIGSILGFISERFLSISQCDSFLSLDVETLCVILSHDGLITASELDVFHAAMQWVYSGSSQRSQFLETVMECVRFPLMTQVELFRCINGNYLLKANERCLDMIHRANWIRTALALNMHDPLALEIPNPRCRSILDDTYSSYINNNATPSNLLDVSFGNIENEENYTSRAPGNDVPTERQTTEQIQIANKQQEHHANIVENCADQQSTIGQTWSPDGCESYSSIELDGKIYAIGGFHQHLQLQIPQPDAWVYNPGNGWQSLAPMKTARMHHTLCVLDGFIHAIGGVGINNRVLWSAERYDPVTDQWQFVEPMTKARADVCAEEHDGKVFVGGGLTVDCSTSCYIEGKTYF